MSPERWQQIKSVYGEALERQGAEREAFLEQACGADVDLRGEVDSLLREKDASGLESPIQAPDWTGRDLGPFHLVEKIGVGGMGAVWKAKDAKLGRTVALKFVAAHNLSGETQQRLLREAQASAALDHPNICHVYGIHEEQGETFIAMAFVDGPSLADKIKERPLPLNEAVDIAIQIAEGLQEAHEKGIVHRDIKPANVMLTAKGQVKITDFGLASLADRSKLTKTGTTLGTPAYMAPEQLQARQADHRADIWALGCVLYEMLTQRTPFEAEYEQAIAYRILHEDPEPVTAVRSGIPVDLDRVIAKALARAPGERYQTVSDLMVDLKSLRKTLEADHPNISRAPAQQSPAVQTSGGLLQARSATPAAPPVQAPASGSKASRLVWLSWALTTLLAVVTAFLLWRAGTTSSPVPEASIYRFALLPPEGGVIKSFALSPNGRYLAYVVEEGKEARLWLRPLDESSARPVRGAEGADPLGTPFWSPDSRFIGFFAEGKLKKVSISGTPPEVLADTPFGRGGAWNDRDTIVFAPLNGGPSAQLFQVAGSGGEVSRVTSPGDDSHRHPFFLPDGRRFLFRAGKILSGTTGVREIRVGSLDSEQTSVLLKADSHAVLIPSANPAYGHLLLTVRENVLLAYPFDAEKAEIVGDPAPLVESVGIDALMMRGLFSASATGSLAYSSNNSPIWKTEILWVDRRGRKIAEAGPPGYYLSPRLSPDGTKVAIVGINSKFAHLVFMMNLERRVVSVFAPELRFVRNLAWSADGARIVLGEWRNVFLKDVDGGRDAQVLLEFEGEGRPGFIPSSWSPGGKWVLGLRRPDTAMALRIGGDPWVLSLDGQPRLTAFFESEYAEGFPEFSPDGRWVAYSSDESGREEVYVTPFPKADRKWPVSSDGGTSPAWGRQGKELLYVSPAGELMAAPVQLGAATFQAGKPQQLFPVETASNNPWRTFDVGPDAQRFLVLRSLEETVSSPVHVVVNWLHELRDLRSGPQ